MLPLAIMLKQKDDCIWLSANDKLRPREAQDVLDRHEIAISSLRSLQSSDSIQTVVRSSAAGDTSVVKLQSEGAAYWPVASS